MCVVLLTFAAIAGGIYLAAEVHNRDSRIAPKHKRHVKRWDWSNLA